MPVYVMRIVCVLLFSVDTLCKRKEKKNIENFAAMLRSYISSIPMLDFLLRKPLVHAYKYFPSNFPLDGISNLHDSPVGPDEAYLTRDQTLDHLPPFSAFHHGL